jgi:hypothetical protein
LELGQEIVDCKSYLCITLSQELNKRLWRSIGVGSHGVDALMFNGV